MDCEAAEPIGFSKQGMMVPISCLQKYPIIFGKIAIKKLQICKSNWMSEHCIKDFGMAKEKARIPVSICWTPGVSFSRFGKPSFGKEAVEYVEGELERGRSGRRDGEKNRSNHIY